MAQKKPTRLVDYFADYDPVVQRIIRRVIDLEKRYLDSKRPRVKEDIRDVIEEEAKKL